MRSFIAIEISNMDVIESINEIQSKIKLDAKPIDSKNLHFTLQFLGEVSEELVHKIIKALQTIKFSGFVVNLKGIGVFPRPTSPRIIWIGTDKNGGNMLVELSKKIQNVLEPLGLVADKSFKPHITIFRIKKKIGDITKDLEDYKGVDFGMFQVTNIKLKKSKLTPKGPIYSDIEEFMATK